MFPYFFSDETEEPNLLEDVERKASGTIPLTSTVTGKAESISDEEQQKVMREKKERDMKERRRLDAIAEKKKEVQAEAFVASIGAAAVSLVPGLGVIMYLYLSDNLDTIDVELIPAIPIGISLVASLLVFGLSVPSSGDVIDAKSYDTDFARNIRSVFSSIPKSVVSSIVQAATGVVNRITNTPNWILGILKVSVYTHILQCPIRSSI